MARELEAKTRVLVVEDDSWIRTFLCDVLSDAGYAVLEAADGRTGLRLAEQERPQLILLDLGMPGLTGIDVLTELRRSPWARKLPVLILSAYANLLAVRSAGPVAGVLGKPLDVSELLLAIDQAINRGTDRRTNGEHRREA